MNKDKFVLKVKNLLVNEVKEGGLSLSQHDISLMKMDIRNDGYAIDTKIEDKLSDEILIKIKAVWLEGLSDY